MLNRAYHIYIGAHDWCQKVWLTFLELRNIHSNNHIVHNDRPFLAMTTDGLFLKSGKEGAEQSRNFTQNHFAKLVVVNFPIVVGVCLGNHLFHFFVGEPFAKVHHAVLELLLADVTVTVPIEHPKSKKG